MNDRISIALAKGRLASRAVEIFNKLGIKINDDITSTRKLVIEDESGKYRFLLVKPSDVATYVENGVCDLGFIGKDSLLEAGADVYELIDLKFGACKLCVCGYLGCDYTRIPKLKVATKYVEVAKRYFGSLGQDVEIIELHGSVELAPITGLADVIFDIVESGSTLKANGLVVLTEVLPSSARLICNKVSLKTKSESILKVISDIEKQIG